MLEGVIAGGHMTEHMDVRAAEAKGLSWLQVSWVPSHGGTIGCRGIDAYRIYTSRRGFADARGPARGINWLSWRSVGTMRSVAGAPRPSALVHREEYGRARSAQAGSISHPASLGSTEALSSPASDERCALGAAFYRCTLRVTSTPPWNLAKPGDCLI